MIEARFKDDCESIVVTGLYQWDYGQELRIYGINASQNMEVHFSVSGQKALIVLPKIKEDHISAMIPDELLTIGQDLKAYVYFATPDQGETIRVVWMPVACRPKPDDYDAPYEKNLLRQVLEKLDKKADNIIKKDGYLYLRSGETSLNDPVLLPSGEGTSIERITNEEIDNMMKG